MVTLIARNLLQRKNKCKFDSRIKLWANILNLFCSWQREWVVVSLIVVVLVTLGSVVAVVIVVVVTAVVGLMQSIRTMPQSDPNAGESCHKQHINCTQCLPKARREVKRESREGVRQLYELQSLRSWATSYSISCRYRAMHVSQHFD